MTTQEQIETQTAAIISYQVDVIMHCTDNNIELKPITKTLKWRLLELTLSIDNFKLRTLAFIIKVSDRWNKKNY